MKMMKELDEIWDGRLGTVRKVKHRIDFEEPDAKPIQSAPYRDGPKEQEIKKEEIDKLVYMNLAEPAQSEWPSKIVSSSKKDGLLRFCFDYRFLNAINIRDSYPIQIMDKCNDSLGNDKVFPTLDANS